MSNLKSQLITAQALRGELRRKDPHLVPPVLVKALFGVMLCALGIVGYATFTDQPNVGVLYEAPIVAERTVMLTGERSGIYRVTELDGTLIATSSDDMAGFLGVVGRVLDRQRASENVTAPAPVIVARRENGNIAVIDTATTWSVELIGYGADNVAAFGNLLD